MHFLGAGKDWMMSPLSAKAGSARIRHSVPSKGRIFWPPPVDKPVSKGNDNSEEATVDRHSICGKGSSKMRVHRIPVGPFATNCIILSDEDGEGLIFDPGGDGELIVERIETLKMAPKMIILTHGHMDHCLEASFLASRYGIPIAMHPDDLPLYEHLEEQVRVLLGPLAGSRYLKGPVVAPTVLLREGDKVQAGSVVGEVLHLPGHSPGGIGVLFRPTKEDEKAVLVCGDTIFKDGIGRTDLWGGDFDTLIKSIKEKVFSLPWDTVLLCGHGAETTVGREKAFFPY